MKSEKEKMLAGELYNALDAQLTAERTRARRLIKALNATGEDEAEERAGLVRELFGSVGEGFWIEPPFYCDYGAHITVGDHVYFNFNCTLLDVAPVSIGSRVLLGPGVQVYTATHPLSAAERRKGLEFAKPITIGDDVWIGGGAILCPGVNIGPRAVIGAGSVVTKDIPADTFAAGNPCRVIRKTDI